MTNLKKSFGVLVFAAFSLAFCLMLVSQSAIAESGKKWKFERISIDGSGVPLPAPDEQVPTKSRLSYAPTPIGGPTNLEGEVVTVQRDERPIATFSAEQGGDTYATAVALTGPFPQNTTGTTVGATQDYAATCAGPSASGDVVYSYTPTTAGTALEVDLCASAYDTRVWVMADDGTNPLVEVACDDDGCGAPGYQSFLSGFPVDVGTTYYIVIGGWGGDEGTYDMTLTEYITMLDCEAPLPITFSAGDGLLDDEEEWAVDLSLGQCDGIAISTNPTANGLYFEFTAQASGLYTFSWCDDGVTNYPITWITGISYPACGLGGYNWSLGSGGCAVDGAYEMSYVMLPGWTQLLEIFDNCEGLSGTLTITREVLVAENDDCADFIPLPAGEGTYFIHNVEATLDGPAVDFCDPAGETCGDIWYTWEAATTGYALFDMCGWQYGESGFDSKIALFEGTDCLDVTPRDALGFGCSDDGCGEFGSGGLVELAVTAGDQFLIRISGWFNDEYPCAAGGMGTGYLDIIEQATSIRPVNDNCPDVATTLLTDGVRVEETGNVIGSSWGDCPGAYADGTLGVAWAVWHAVELTDCSDLVYDFCGTSEYPGGDRYSYGGWTDVAILTGCPCEGDFNSIVRDYWSYAGTCTGYPTDSDFNVEWGYSNLLPGAYYVQASAYDWGANATFWPTYDYWINFTATTIPCAICDGSANENSVPPIGSTTWIKNVTFADIAKVGVDFYYDGTVPPEAINFITDMNGYEDHTDMIAHVYRGLDYDFDCLMERYNSNPDANDLFITYIDWNQNSGLAARPEEGGEAYPMDWTAINPLDPEYHFYETITVPMDAALPGEGTTGETRMRLRLAKGTDGPMSACGERVFGEVEDFTIEVADLECGDFDVDFDVDADDIAFLYAYYFSGGPAPDYWQRGDMDNDGMITVADLIILADLAYSRIIGVTCI